jgi:hypothetical protein
MHFWLHTSQHGTAEERQRDDASAAAKWVATPPVGRALHAKQVARRVSLAQEDRLELVHACVGEQQRRVVVRYDRRRRHIDVAALHKEVHERLAHAGCRPRLHRHAHRNAQTT